MAEYLLFQLYGPMASWGEAAVGEVRHSASWPTRSSLTGLLGAALGIDRQATEDQARLVSDYRFAIKILSEGTALRDYHTVQSSVPSRGRTHRSRRQQLEQERRSELSTLLTYRDYRSDAWSVVAIEALESARWALGELADALRRPRFALYLGRKSCPLAAPMKPEISNHPSVDAALDTYVPGLLSALTYRNPERLRSAPVEHCLLDGADPEVGCVGYCWELGMQIALSPTFEHERADQPLSRQRWQFTKRREFVHFVNALSGRER